MERDGIKVKGECSEYIRQHSQPCRIVYERPWENGFLQSLVQRYVALPEKEGESKHTCNDEQRDTFGRGPRLLGGFKEHCHEGKRRAQKETCAEEVHAAQVGKDGANFTVEPRTKPHLLGKRDEDGCRGCDTDRNAIGAG
jgi:hypothetical protein